MAAHRRVDGLVTCGLNTCTAGSAPGPTLGNEYGRTIIPLPLRYLIVLNIAISVKYQMVSISQFARYMFNSECSETDKSISGAWKFAIKMVGCVPTSRSPDDSALP